MTSPNLEADLIRDEGKRSKAYKDSRGIFTIGIGHNIQADPTLLADLGHLIDPGISDERINALFMHDLAEVTHELDLHLPWWRQLDDIRQDVLANMTFNMGIATLLEFTNTLAAIRRGDFEDAARRMLQSRWASQVHSRATRLAEQMRTGVHQP